MPGSKIGGQKAAKKNKELYGEDFYKNIGVKGGKAGTTGGYYGDTKRARKSGSKGGRKSLLGHKLVDDRGGYYYYINKTTNAYVKYKHNKRGFRVGKPIVIGYVDLQSHKTEGMEYELLGGDSERQTES